jgi:hypothetical protein
MTRSLAVAFLLPCVLTAAVLAGVAANRSGGRDPIVLTERELVSATVSDDNSASRAFLTWETPADDARWLTREKLASLGFDVSVDASDSNARDHYSRALPRQVWVAFEFDGPAWQEVVRSAAANLAPDLISDHGRQGANMLRSAGSRPVPVDAAAGVGALDKRYPNPRTHLISSGIVRPLLIKQTGKPPYVTGVVESVVPRELHVPREFRAALGGGRYHMSVRYGRRFELWIVAVSH